MKNLIILLLLIPMLGFSQDDERPKMPYDSTTNTVIYKKIFTCDTFKKAQIFDAAMLYVAQAFNSANNVVQLKDRENGKIVINAVFDAYVNGLLGKTNAGYFNYTWTISIKDGKVKSELTSFNHIGIPGTTIIGQGPIEIWWQKKRYPFNGYLIQIDQHCKKLELELENKINLNLTTNSKSDW